MPANMTNSNADFYDRRILQMEFENRSFQRNIAKSKKSVEDFKKVLNFDETSKGLEKFAESANSLDFSKMESYMERLADKFTGIGDVGEYAISRVRSAIESTAGKVESFVKALTLEQFNVGQSKYDAFNKAVMTITSTTEYTEEQVKSVFERLMTYTDETSYAFGDMVNQISSFTTAGVGLTQAEKAMEGIANASALAGQGVSQASAAMNIFSKAMGQGFLSLQQWQSLNLTAHLITPQLRQAIMEAAVEVGTITQDKSGKYRIGQQYRSDAAQKAKQKAEELQRQAERSKTAKNLQAAQKAAATAAEYENKAIVSMDNLENTLHDKWVTKEVMAKALGKFYFEEIDNPDANWDTFAGKAAKAAQRATSLTDAMNALKESISGGWMTSFRHFWGDIGEAMVTFTGLANRLIEVFEPIQEFRNGILEAWAARGGRGTIVHALLGGYTEDIESDTVGFLDLLESAGKLISHGFSEFFKMFVPEQERQYWDAAGYQEYFFSDMLYNFTKSISGFFGAIRDYMNGEVLVGGETKSRLQLISEIILGIVSVFKLAYDVVTGFFGFLQKVASQFTVLDTITGLLANLGLSVHGTVQSISDAKTIPQFFSNLAENLKPVTSVINLVVEDLANLIRVIFGLENQNGTKNEWIEKLGNGIRTVGSIVSKYGKKVIQFFSKFGSIIHNVIKSGFSKESLQKAWTDVSTLLLGGVMLIINTISDRIPEEVKRKIRDIIAQVKEFATTAYIDISAFFAKLFKPAQNTGTSENPLGKIFAWLQGVWASIKEFFSGNLLDSIQHLLAIAQQKWAGISAYFQQSFGARIISFLDWLWRFVKQVGGYAVLIYGAVSVIGIIRKIVNVFSSLSTAISNITTIFARGIKLQPNVVTDKADKFMKIATAITMIVGSIVGISLMPWDMVRNAFYLVIGVMVALELFVAAMSSTFKGMDNKKVLGFAGLIGGVAVIMLSLIPIGYMDQAALIQAGIALTVLLGLLAGFSYLMALIRTHFSFTGTDKDSIDGIGILATSVLKFVGALILLALIPDNALKKAGNALAQLLGVVALFSFFIALIGLMGNKSGLDKDALGGVTKLASGILILSISLIPLALIPKKLLKKAGNALAQLLAIIVIFSALMSFIGGNGLQKGNLDGIIKLALAMAILIGVFAASMVAIKDIKWETMLSFTAGLTLIAGAIWLLSKVDLIAGLKGILLLGVGVAALMEIVKLILPGLIEAFAAGLQQAGGRLRFASETITTFIANMAGISDSDSDRALGMMGKIKDIMIQAKEIGGMSDSITNFIVNLNRLRIAVGNYGDVDRNGIQNAIVMIERLGNTSGKLTSLSKINLSTFIGGLSGLGGAMSIYASGAEELGNIPEDKTPSAEHSIKILEELSQGLIDHGPFKIPENFPTDLAIGTFAGQLVALAKGMTDFEKAGSQLGDGTDKAIECLKFFGKLVLILNGYISGGQYNISGVVTYFKDNDIDTNVLNTFALDIQALGDGLARFADATTVIDKETGEAKPINFEDAIGVLESFVNMEGKLKDPKTFSDWLLGVKDYMGTLATDITAISSSLSDFTKTSSELSGKKAERDEALSAIGDFVDYVKDDLNPKLKALYKNTGSMVVIINSEERVGITQITDAMATVGSDLKTFGEGLASIQWSSEAENQKSALTALSDFIDYSAKLRTKLPIMDSALASLWKWLTEGERMTIGDVSEEMAEVGENLGKFGEGISGKFKNLDEITLAMTALTGFAEVMQSLAKIIDFAYFSGGAPDIMVSGLVQFIKGFTEADISPASGKEKLTAISAIVAIMKDISDQVNGVKDFNAQAVTSFGELMRALSYINELKSGTDFTKIGKAITDGIYAGVNSTTDKAIEAVSKLIIDIQTILDEGLDVHPVITPVLDPSQLNIGMADINKSLNGSSVTLDTSTPSAYVDSVTTDGSGTKVIVRPTDLTGVLDRMNQLGERIDGIATAFSKIKFVLDTGAIAGAITDKIDLNLGRQNYYVTRRN